MFFAVVITIWTAVHLYVFWRAARVPYVARHVRRSVLAGISAILWISLPVSVALEDVSAGLLARVFEYVGATWGGVIFLLFVTMLAVDVFTAFGLLVPKMAPRIRGYALFAGGVLAAIALVQGARPPVVDGYEVEVANLPAERDGTVVVVASDLHIGALTSERWLTARVRQINDQRPDLVVLAGDIVEGHGESGRELLPSLRNLSAPLGVWAVNGNHETYGRRNVEGNDTLLEKAGFHVLRDQWAEVRPGLIIAGVDDLTSRRRHNQPYARFVDVALAARPTGATIFVSHSPWLAERVAGYGVGLMLSGHTHGGQIWPFNYFVRLTYPLMAGRYDVHGMPVIVCRGTGTWGPPMRLWQRSEILRVILRVPRTQR